MALDQLIQPFGVERVTQTCSCEFIMVCCIHDTLIQVVEQCQNIININAFTSDSLPARRPLFNGRIG